MRYGILRVSVHNLVTFSNFQLFHGLWRTSKCNFIYVPKKSTTFLCRSSQANRTRARLIPSPTHILNKYGNSSCNSIKQLSKVRHKITFLCIFPVKNFKKIGKNVQSWAKTPLKPKAKYSFACTDFCASHNFSSAFHDYIPHQILSEFKRKRRKNEQNFLWQRRKVRFHLHLILVKLTMPEVN